ncbi:glycosyltransferase family 4 protein [Sulfitobacter mediterraneus]|uniref:glycosyltransferase family 4 protein n=1 Tax=Sulfitobacter mediterraneus TaxID=83219 RepID=UPI00193489AC|nr:glycosyltransferase family 4 protein [Sulfitobacter mediterraneus]MBM1311151.1 glycosyltransferase family 4 protein [Sulfitobacter mediterraneus]MBM1315033.1 glycosyltransferase family 4 protein [Sulfitobacter mediterraneus]MBM1323394.1 glycosyltransferase family 4 protein [Sulfitobacter mediterraneus]MBM1327306.1 glycosyltransferase family 4 protein [Sulfitobacter mediterraneus]MBM1398654.1 glycosyltransferase family 4 protein [Sulfitobacter mediterraneus]
MSHPKLAVVVKGWPRLSETFIAQELVALEETGLEFDIWSLRHPTDKKTHPLHDRLQAKIHYLPEYLRNEPRRVATAMGAAAEMPGFDAAAAAYAADVERDDTANRRRRWGQACVMAAEMPHNVAGIYAHFLHTPSSVARYAAILRGMPWSFSAHAKDIWTSPEWELREKLSATSYGAAFGATCTGFGAEHLQGLADTPSRVDLVYHGLDLSRFPAPPERTLRNAGAPFHMMSVGRLVEKKGFDNLIDALALLPASLNWHWTHIGGGALDAVMRDRAEAHGIAERITWRGACDQPEVIDAMRAADLFVLPSRIAADGDRDGLPNVLMEAASQKLPILSTPVSAIPEFIDSGTHGVLSDDAPAALAEAMQGFASDPTQGAAMAEAAYARLTQDFLMHPGIEHLKKRLLAMLAQAG